MGGTFSKHELLFLVCLCNFIFCWLLIFLWIELYIHVEFIVRPLGLKHLNGRTFVTIWSFSAEHSKYFSPLSKAWLCRQQVDILLVKYLKPFGNISNFDKGDLIIIDWLVWRFSQLLTDFTSPITSSLQTRSVASCVPKCDKMLLFIVSKNDQMKPIHFPSPTK